MIGALEKSVTEKVSAGNLLDNILIVQNWSKTELKERQGSLFLTVMPVKIGSSTFIEKRFHGNFNYIYISFIGIRYMRYKTRNLTSMKKTSWTFSNYSQHRFFVFYFCWKYPI